MQMPLLHGSNSRSNRKGEYHEEYIGTGKRKNRKMDDRYKRSGEKTKLPPYTEYHKKRTLPIILTSFWVLAVTGLYIYDIVGSVKAAI